MGKKKKQEKKQEKEKKQKNKQKKAEKAGQKAGGAKKAAVQKKDAGPDRKRGDTAQAAADERTGKQGGKATAGSSGRSAGRTGGRPAGDRLRGMAERFRALGDENRLQILMLLEGRELCAGDILESLNIAQSTLSHHMKILTESGIVKCRRQGKWAYYSTDSKTREMLDGLLDRRIEKKQQ